MKDPFAELGFTPKATTAPGVTPSIPTATPVQSAPQSDPFASLGFAPKVEEAVAPQPAKPFKYNIPESKEEKMARINRDIAAANAEAKEANSFGGMAKNFGKAFVSNLMPSEVNLGETVGSIINTLGGTLDSVMETQNKNMDTQIATLKTIREKEKKGIDATADKKFYNTLVDQGEEITAQINQMTKGSQKSTGKVLGEIGGTALDVLTAGTYGKVATGSMKTGQIATKTSVGKALGTAASPEIGKTIDIAIKTKPTGLFTKGGVEKVFKGAGIGYANDVTLGLQGARGEEREGGKAFVPGMGTAIGAAIPAVLEGEQSIRNVVTKEGRQARLDAGNEKIYNKREEELFKIENKYAKTRKANDFSKDAGVESRKRVARTDVLVDAVDENGLLRTKNPGGAIDQYKAQTIDGSEGVVRKNLEREGSKVNIKEVEKSMMKAVDESGLEGADLTAAQNRARKEVAGLRLRADKNGDIPLVKIHDAKINNTKNINYQTPPEVSSGRKAIARSLKEIVENKSSTDVKKVNAEIQKYLKDIELLERLDGTRVEGGRLGKYFAQISGNIVGGIAGSAVGGIGGSALGTVIGGELGSRMKGSAFKRTLGGRTGNKAPSSPILEKAIKDAESPRLMLPAPKPNSPRSSIPASGKPINVPPGGFRDQAAVDANYSKSLGNRNAMYTRTANPIKTVIAETVPEVAEKSKDNYLYHGTDKTAFGYISKEGIKPQRRGVSSFSKSEEYSRNWSDNKATNTKGFMLRIKKDFLKGKTVRNNTKVATDKLHEVLTKETIPPEAIEVFRDGKWQPLRDSGKQADKVMVRPEQLSAYGRIKTKEIDSVFDAIPEGTVSPDGFFKKSGGKIFPTEKATPEDLKRNMIAVNPDGSIKDSFTYNKMSFTEDVALPKSSNEKGAISTGALAAGAIGAGGYAVANMPRTNEYRGENENKMNLKQEVDVNRVKDAIAFNETGIIADDKKYTLTKPSGDPKLGNDNGKYQVTDEDLRLYSKRYLGRQVHRAEFLKNPELQEKYMEAKIQSLLDEGFGIAEIFAFHRGGMTNRALNAKNKISKYQKYVESGVNHYNSK